MKNVGGTSEYIAFLDECGDHTLELIDKDFPLFLLATVVEGGISGWKVFP